MNGGSRSKCICQIGAVGNDAGGEYPRAADLQVVHNDMPLVGISVLDAEDKFGSRKVSGGSNGLGMVGERIAVHLDIGIVRGIAAAAYPGVIQTGADVAVSLHPETDRIGDAGVNRHRMGREPAVAGFPVDQLAGPHAIGGIG